MGKAYSPNLHSLALATQPASLTSNPSAHSKQVKVDSYIISTSLQDKQLA